MASFLFMFGLFTTLAFLIVLFEDLDVLLENDASFVTGLMYVLLNLPHQIVKASPFIVLLSVVVTTGKLMRTQELLMLFVAGYSPFRILAPIAIALLVYVGTIIVVNEQISGPAAARAHSLMQFDIQGSEANLATETNLWLHGEGDSIYFIETYYPFTQTMSGVTILEFQGENRTLSQRMDAEVARWDAESGTWQLDGVVAHRIHEDGSVERRVETEPEAYLITQTPEDLSRTVRLEDTERMSHSDLSEVIRSMEEAGVNPIQFLPDLRIKEAFPFAVFCLGVMGYALLVLSGVSSQASGIGMGLLACIGYFLSLSLGKSLAESGLFSPWIGAWGPNLVCLLITAFCLRRLQQRV